MSRTRVAVVLLLVSVVMVWFSGAVMAGDVSTSVNSAVAGVSAESAKGPMIDINTATVEELMALKGIGEKIAKRIVEYREANGPFQTVEDLKNVKGIGEKILEKNLGRITVGEIPKAGE